MKRRRVGRDVDHYPIMRRDAAALGDLFACAERERERALRLRAEDPPATDRKREEDGYEK